MSRTILYPRKLQRSDDRTGFSSGAGELDEWLVKYAWRNQTANSAITYVITDADRVVGYYAIAMTAYARENAPVQMRKGMPGQMPCILLARLAVDVSVQGEGWGVELLRDALLRSAGLSESIGAAAVLIHCRDEVAKHSYLQHGDFQQSPVEDMHLMIPVKVIEEYVD